MYLLLADGWIELLARGLTPERATLAAASWKIPAAPAADKEETSEMGAAKRAPSSPSCPANRIARGIKKKP